MLKQQFLRTTYWINDFLHGSPIRSKYLTVKKLQTGGGKLKKLKDDKLHTLLHHAVLNCPFYRGIESGDLFNFPVVNKKILTQNHDLIAVEHEKIPGQKGAIHIQHTSGSTGTPFHIPQDTRKRQNRIAELKYFGEIVGFKSHDNLLHLRIWTNWHNKSRLQAFKENIVPFDMSNLKEDKLKELCGILIKRRISCIRGYASTFDHLARFAADHGYKFPHLKIIIAGSEALQETTRENVHKYLGCDIISQYANEENGILGQQRTNDPTGAFYLNHAGYIFELLKLDSDEPVDEGELGRIVITDLNNYAFPVIRYDTGDLATWGKGVDEYGHKYFSQLYGRRLDLIYNTSGNPISPMVLSRVLKNFEEIVQWQFIQKTSNNYNLRIISRNNVLSAEKEIIEQLKKYFGNDAIFKTDLVDDIPVLGSGKRKSVVCEYKKETINCKND